jgi:hypothetical protein
MLEEQLEPAWDGKWRSFWWQKPIVMPAPIDWSECVPPPPISRDVICLQCGIERPEKEPKCPVCMATESRLITPEWKTMRPVYKLDFAIPPFDPRIIVRGAV